MSPFVPLLLLSVAADPVPPAAPPTVRVAVFAGEGALKTRGPVAEHVESVPGFQAELVTAEDIRAGKLDGCAAVIFPGGLSLTQSINLGEDGKAKVKEFVKNGGGYMGICAGAYLASCAYKWSLQILDADIVDKDHWARGTGPAELKLAPVGKDFFGLKDDAVTIYFGQGPLLTPAKNADVDDYEPLALYETDIAKRGGATPGLMKGTTAAARGTFGAGRVFCFSPHPEKTKTDDAKQMFQKAIVWVTKTDAPALPPTAAK